MNDIRRAMIAALAVALITAPGIGGQERRAGVRDAYFRAVAEFFGLPRSEVSILGDWQIPPDEIPVVLFLAHHAGISAEAIVALRRSGKAWSELAGRYEVGPAQFYVPIPEGASAGILQGAYDRYRSIPISGWGRVALTDRDIVSLVNLRMLQQTLHVPPEDVLAVARAGSWLDVYARLLKEPDGTRGAGTHR